MRIRTGRKNPRNLYLQVGESPADSDPCLGLIIDPEVAVLVTGAVGADDAQLIGYALTRVGKR